jgi:hypothetical protein
MNSMRDHANPLVESPKTDRDVGDSLRFRWNSTEVYLRVGGTWKIVHSHWSYTKPELKQGNQ